MLNKPEECKGCPLEHKGKGFVPDDIKPNAKFIVFGEAPGSTEVTQGKPFQGKAGFVLKQWIMKAIPQLQIAEEKHKISYCNVLKCLPPEVQGRPYPKGEEKELAEAHCKQYMQLDEKVETIILCGESPQRFFFDEELSNEDAEDRSLGHDLKGVMGRIGRVYNRDNKRWVFAPHPAYILRQPALVQHGQESFRIGAGVDKPLEPEYVQWEEAVKELL